MQQFVTGLKSRSDDTRSKAACDLNHYVTTELREVSVDDLTTFMDEFNHQIFEMVSSADVNERKGGILAIGLCVDITESFPFTSLLKLYKFMKEGQFYLWRHVQLVLPASPRTTY